MINNLYCVEGTIGALQVGAATKKGGPLASGWMDVRRFWSRACVYICYSKSGWQMHHQVKVTEVAGRWFTLRLGRCVFSSAANVTVRGRKK